MGFSYAVAPFVIDERSHGLCSKVWMSRMAKRFMRGQDGKLTHALTEIFPIIKPDDNVGKGDKGGLYTFASEYIKAHAHFVDEERW